MSTPVLHGPVIPTDLHAGYDFSAYDIVNCSQQILVVLKAAQVVERRSQVLHSVTQVQVTI